MHQDPGDVGIGDQRRHVRIGAAATDVVDDTGTAFQRGARHSGMHGVDTHGDAGGGKLFHDGNDPGGLDIGIDAGRAGPRGFAADVDDRGPFGD